MSVVYLVRHGQASLLGHDYDKLSERGVEQSRLVGTALAARGVRPAVVVRGALERHRETTTAALDAASWDVPVDVDPSWDEINHIDIIGAQQPSYTSHSAMVEDLLTKARPEQYFRGIFDEALQAWLLGGDSYVESHQEFRGRVVAGLATLTQRLGEGETAVVFTSGGPVSAVAATALGVDPAGWLSLSRLTINASVTKLVYGAAGVTLISFNEHAHVEGAGQLTYH